MTDEQSAASAAFERQRAAMAVEGLTCPEKAILLVLAIMGDRAGRSHPSVDTLADRASCGRRTAFRALDRLAELELIERDTITGKGTWYTLGLDPCHSGTSARAAPVPDRHSTRATAAPKQPRTTMRKKTTSSPSTRDAAEPSSEQAGTDLPLTAVAAASPARRTPRADIATGTRLAPDFEPPADWIEWAVAERRWTHDAAAAEAVEFRDYWIAQPGQRGRKADWPATWRNWVRRSRRHAPNRGGPDGQRAYQHSGDRSAGAGRDRPVDGFTAALRAVSAGGRAHDDGGG